MSSYHYTVVTHHSEGVLRTKKNLTCSNHYVWCCHILLTSPCKEDFKNWKKGWLFPPTSCSAQKLAPSLKMAKNGCSLSMFVPCTIEKPMKRDFEKSKKMSTPPISCPTWKSIPGPKMSNIGCLVNIVVSYAIGKPMERRFQNDQYWRAVPATLKSWVELSVMSLLLF